MSAYQPVDLSGFYNAGHEVLGPGGKTPLGAVVFRGLPFQLGGDGARCLLACGGGASNERVEIQLGRKATWLVIAQRLLESGIGDNGPVGEKVAEFVFEFADGQSVAVPVRDRFEIATVPPSGGSPFVAVADCNDQLLPRDSGEWEAAGRRQTEVSGGRPRHFVLWGLAESPSR